jgi:6-phosphogluconolactonase (cycloisomerase 2 family)/phosphodiesterase/alkaline phosphatase D-like protein
MLKVARTALMAGPLVLALLAACPVAFAANVYVANNTAGTISQFSAAPDGALTPLSPATVTTDAGPQGITVGPGAKNLYTANFTASTVTRFTIAADGTLSATPVQTLAVNRAQAIRFSPDGLSAYVSESVAAGEIAQFSVAADGALTPKSPASVAAGNAPGPVVFNASATRAYAGNTATGVGQFSVAADGTLTPLTPAVVAAGGTQSRIVALSPDGTSLYSANTANNTVSFFSVSPSDGTLSLTASYPTGGQPRGIAASADGTGVYVANSRQDATGNSVSQYTRAANGALTPKAPATVATGGLNSNSITLSPDGPTAYVSNQSSANVTLFTIGADGSLTAKSPSLAAAGTGANAIAFTRGQVTTAAPTVETGAASSITDAGASVAGTVNPNGAATSTTFEYGPTLAFGSISPVTSAGSQAGAVAASATLSGLAPGTTTYYRLVAVNALGERFGVVHSLRTTGASAAPVAITQPATGTDTSSTTLHGIVNPRAQQTAFAFEYGTSPSFGAISAVVALDDADGLEPVSATLSGLAPDTTYYARLVATNATGTDFGAVVAFTTGPGGAPIATTGAAGTVTATSATLTAVVDAHGAATTFTFEYGPSNAFGSLSAVDTLEPIDGGQAVSLPIGGLAPATTYRYRIVATNAGGTTAGAVQSFTTSPAA